MRLIILGLACIFFSFNLLGQNNPDHATKEFIELTFEGGNVGYMDYFEANLDFPKISYQDGIEGLLLFSFTIDTEKAAMDFTFFTKLDENIEASVKRTVQSTRSKWTIQTPGKYTVYQPIVFSQLPYYPQTLEGDLPPLPQALPPKYLQLFVLIKSKRIPENFDLEDTGSGNPSDKEKTVFVRAEQYYEKYLEAGNNERAYRMLNRLIRYQPLKKEYLMKRIELEKALGVNEFQVYDAMLLNDFVATMKPMDSYESTRAAFAGDAYGDEPDQPGDYRVFQGLYKGGLTRFLGDLALYYALPSIQYVSRSSGVLLIEIKSNAEGQLEASLLTNYDSPVSRGLKNALKVMSFNWHEPDSAIHKIFPIFLGSGEPMAQGIAQVLDDYQLLKHDLFFTPYEMYGMASEMAEMDLTITEEQRTNILQNSMLYARYQDHLADYNAYLLAEKPKKAGQSISRAIELNPFSIVLLKKRLAIDDKKTQQKFSSYDKRLIAILESIQKQ